MDYDFKRCFEKLSGVAHTVASTAEAAAKVAEICRGQQAGCIALANLEPETVALIEQTCSDMTVLKEPYEAESLPASIDRAAVGITGIAFAIAQSGTMVEISDDDSVRLVSSLPRTYIGIVRQQDIINGYYDSAALIRDIVAAHDRSLVISFISGPSRTGDIELKLTLGVHGPEQAHCIIIAADRP